MLLFVIFIHFKFALKPLVFSQTWVPVEHFLQFQHFMMLHRGSLSVLVHPLGDDAMADHTTHSMFLGDRWPIDTSIFEGAGGGLEPAQYPQLGLGYNAVK